MRAPFVEKTILPIVLNTFVEKSVHHTHVGLFLGLFFSTDMHMYLPSTTPHYLHSSFFFFFKTVLALLRHFACLLTHVRFSLSFSAKEPAEILIVIILNLCINLGHSNMKSSNLQTFIQILKFLTTKFYIFNIGSSTYFYKYIKYFIVFDVLISGIFQMSFSGCLLLTNRSRINDCILTLYPVTLLSLPFSVLGYCR